MSVKYEVLKALVKAIGIKRRWNGNVEELLESRRKSNAKNRIPALSDPEIEISCINISGCPVVTMKHMQRRQRWLGADDTQGEGTYRSIKLPENRRKENT